MGTDIHVLRHTLARHCELREELLVPVVERYGENTTGNESHRLRAITILPEDFGGMP